MQEKQRVIKFRFFDTSENKMSSDPDLGLTSDGITVYLDWGGGVSVEKKSNTHAIYWPQGQKRCRNLRR